jgi:hypothetical protein
MVCTITTDDKVGLAGRVSQIQLKKEKDYEKSYRHEYDKPLHEDRLRLVIDPRTVEQGDGQNALKGTQADCPVWRGAQPDNSTDDQKGHRDIERGSEPQGLLSYEAHCEGQAGRTKSDPGKRWAHIQEIGEENE